MQFLTKFIRFTCLLLFLFPVTKSFGGWTTVSSGINDNLKSINCWGNNAVVVGNHGIYYSTTGISTSWTKYVITGNSSDSLTLTRCKFSKVTSKWGESNKPYFCGQDTVNKTAIIFFIDMATMNYSFIYTGPVNSNINDMCSDYTTPYIPNLYCVGDSGFFVYTRNFVNFNVVPVATTKNFKAIYTKNLGYIEIVGDEVYYKGHDNGTTITFNGYYLPGMFFTDIEGDDNIANTSIATGNGKAYKITSGVPTEITNHDFGQLNATSCSF